MLVFSNGDKLTGKLDHEADGSVSFASDNAGSVDVPWAKLKELHTAGRVCRHPDGHAGWTQKANTDIPVGTISIEGDTLTVNTKDGARQIPVKNIAYIVDQATFEKNVNKKQGLTEGITGAISAGVSTVSSTQNSVSINTAVVLARVVPAGRLDAASPAHFDQLQQQLRQGHAAEYPHGQNQHPECRD